MIEKASQQDSLEIKDLILETVQVCFDVSEEQKQELVTMIQESLEIDDAKRDTSISLIFREEGVIVGALIIKDYSNLSHLFVLPRHHRRGIARQLLRRGITLCQESSPGGKLRLNSSTHAAEFYRSMGFLQLGAGRDLPGGCIPFEMDLHS